MKDATGGGDVAPLAPEATAAPVDPAAPAQGAQPAAPVSGGGAPASGTTYDAAPEPVACGQWVPAPVATGPTPPTSAPAPAPTAGPDTPPEPIAVRTAPASTGTPAPGATTPASQLPTWPQWQGEFSRLGLPQADIAKLGAANLTDAQLAQVYGQVHEGIVAAGGVPGQSPVPGTAPTSTWDAEWEQRFLALGLQPEFVAELKAQAAATGADDAKLESVYQQLVVAKGQAGEPAPADPTLPTTPTGPAAPQQEGPGWNPQVEQAFRELGMPDEVIQIYAQSGAPLAGLEAAHKHAAARVQDFTDRGWMQKFEAAGVPATTTWQFILGDQPAKDKDLEAALEAQKKAGLSKTDHALKWGASLFPGGRLIQYAMGKEVISGEKIDRTDWKEIGFAALSGAAAFAAIRGGRNVMAGISARNGGFAALNSTNGTLAGLGLKEGGVAAVSDAAMGATQTWGFKQKLLSFIPGTALHKEVVGLGHAEAAARAFNNGGAAKMLWNDADGALQLSAITRLFDDIKSGAVRMHGGSYAYLGPFKGGPIMTLDAAKGVETIKVAKNLKMWGNGNSQLVGLMEMAGTKLGRDPEWLSNARYLVDDIAELSSESQKALGRVMAGNVARDLGAFTKDGIRPMRYIAGLARSPQPEWYTSLATKTMAQSPIGKVQQLLVVRTVERALSGMFDDAATAIAKLDVDQLTPEAKALLDDTAVKMGEARTALAAAKDAGGLTDEAKASVASLNASVERLRAEDGVTASAVFGDFMDDGAMQMAQVRAGDAVRAEWLDEVAAGTAKVATESTDEAATTATRALTAPAAGTPTPAPATAPAPAPAPAPAGPTTVPLHLDAEGRLVSPSGLDVTATSLNPTRPAQASHPENVRFERFLQSLRTD